MFLSIGVSKEEFLEACPVDLECYIKAEEMVRKRRDAERWQMGIYNMSAFSVALSGALGGKKSKAKYVEKPLLESLEQDKKEKEDEENLSEEQLDREREKLLMQLMVMQANFELQHSGEDK